VPRPAALLALLLLGACASAPKGSLHSYAEAELRWRQSTALPGYKAFSEQFLKMNDASHFAQKSGCLAKEGGPVQMILVLGKLERKPLIIIQDTFTDVSNPKAKCLAKLYRGLQTNIPPYMPFLVPLSID
jgi:hypothetical protein